MWKVPPLIRFRWLFILAILFPSLVCAQGVQYTRKEAGDGGTAVPYPLVTVCTSGAAYTPLPCTPKASIYSDAALTVPLANPFRGDMFGNIEFYATPAAYVVSVTAPYSPGYSFKMSASGGFAGSIASTQVGFGSAVNTFASDPNFTWNNTAKSLAVTNSGLSGIAPIYAIASGVTVNEAGIVAQCQQLGNFFCEAGQFVASDSGAGPIGSVIGIASVPSHTAAGTLATMTGVDVTPAVGNGAGAITTSRGVHVAGVTFPTGTSPTTHDGIIVDDQCSGSFPATNCTGIRVAAQSNGKPGVTAGNINGILYVGTGYYASLQAAHDALPSTGGTIFVMATGTPWGATALVATKPMHVILDCANFTYSGSATAITTSSRGVTWDGCGPRGDDTGTAGTTITITNTAANGIVNSGNGAIFRGFNLVGPGSGTGTGMLDTAGRGTYSNLNISSFGSDGWVNDGSATNSNSVFVTKVRSSHNGGNGFLAKGSNGQLVNFIETDAASNTGDGYNISNQLNVFLSTNADSNTGCDYHFLSGGILNTGTIFSNNAVAGPPGGICYDAGATSNYFTQTGAANIATDAGSSNLTYFPGNQTWSGLAASPRFSSLDANLIFHLNSGNGGATRGSTMQFENNGTNKWYFQKSTSDAFNFSDAVAGIPRFQFTTGSISQIESGGTSAVRFNDVVNAATGTGGVEFYSGGAGSAKTAFILGTGYANLGPVTVAALPAAAAGNKGNMITVSDSTAIAAEGQACVGGGAVTALAFSTGLAWKCF